MYTPRPSFVLCSEKCLVVHSSMAKHKCTAFNPLFIYSTHGIDTAISRETESSVSVMMVLDAEMREWYAIVDYREKFVCRIVGKVLRHRDIIVL